MTHMKRILITLLTLLALACPAFAADWYYLGNSNDGLQYYIDNSSVEKNAESALVWCKAINTDGSFFVARYAFIRKGKLAATLSTSIYDANGNYISGYNAPLNPYALQWMSITPDTAGELIYYSIWPY